jgi:hypothetical protein
MKLILIVAAGVGVIGTLTWAILSTPMDGPIPENYHLRVQHG